MCHCASFLLVPGDVAVAQVLQDAHVNEAWVKCISLVRCSADVPPSEEYWLMVWQLFIQMLF